ncbi:TonB-dependent receptor [Neptunicella sp. SCSIO 80796]|uniref:TonB-dependent receptor n=1 Tax=Neptunicella plasticusilytica TaxID=3117012 RepID=UPI003A4DAC88
MDTQRGFNKTILATTIASILFSFTTQNTFAAQNDDEDDTTEVIKVVGVKGAQFTARETKRLAHSIVDAIAAEDIGKLPDATLTDSLQRITGVQIQRSAGEGSSLSIRGMQQVSVLLNGEQFLAAGNLYSAQPDFTDVPAQLLRAATVYKSTEVSNAQSGITGTIDIETFRPFDFSEGFNSAVGAELSRGEISKENDHTVNGLISWRNDNIGVMVSAVTGVRNLANDYAGRASGDPGGFEMGPGSEFNGQWTVTHGHGFEFFNAADERERNGINASLQADLGNGLKVLVEGFYTDATEYKRSVGLNISNRWQGQGSTSAYQQSLWAPRYSDPNGWSGANIAVPTGAAQTITGEDGRQWVVGSQYDVEPLWIYSNTKNQKFRTGSKNFNFQLDFDNGSPLTGGLRFVAAKANNNSTLATVQGGINNFRGDTVQQLYGHFYPAQTIADYGLTLDPDRLDEVGVDGGRYVLPNPLGYAEDPNLTMQYNGFKTEWGGFDTPIAGGLGNVGLAQYMANKDSWIKEGLQMELNNDTESSMRASSGFAKYTFDDSMVKDIEFGVRKSTRTVSKEDYDYWAQFYVDSDNRITSPDFPTASNITGCYAQWRSIDQKFDGGASGSECSAGERLAGAEDDPTSFIPYFILPPQGLDSNEGEKAIFVEDLGDYVSGIPGFWATDPHSLDNAEDYNRAVFGDIKKIINPGTSYDIDLDEATAYFKANFETDVLVGSLGFRYVKTDIKANIYETTPITRTNGGSVYYTGRQLQEKSRSYFLPTFNMSYMPTDDWVFRMSLSRNKQDLDLNQYGSSLTIFTGPDPDDATQRVPSGWNSAGSIDLEPWLTDNYDLSAEYYFGEASMAAIGAFLVKIDTFVETQQSDLTVEYNGKTYTITGTGPVEGNGGEVKGIELGTKLAFSDLFGEDSVLGNFGIDANYTYSPSERPGNASDVRGDKYPFANNSEHTYNFVAWYQQGPIQARVAVNGRSERFDRDFMGEYGFATYTPSSTYVDINFSYDVMENVTVYLQGSNITGEDYEQVYRLADGVEQQGFIYDNEARYNLGVRAKF